jgi:DNA-binding transcriptional LysR family regulator
MTNVPTDLLRTLIAVVDLRSFTRAAQLHGVTQPAVSAQIKRLQTLLGGELFDKSAPGVTLTAKGEVVVNYARRLLALNDQMLDVTARGSAAARLRIGLATDYFEAPALRAIAEFQAARAGVAIHVCAEPSSALLRDLRRGDYDLVVAASDIEIEIGAARTWLEPTAWGAASAAIAEGPGPIPLVVVGESSLSRRMSVETLERAGIDYEITYVGASFAGMVSAAAAGFGVACWAKRLLQRQDLQVFDSLPRLPRVPDVRGGVHLRDGLERSDLNKLADTLAAVIAREGEDIAETARRTASR